MNPSVQEPLTTAPNDTDWYLGRFEWVFCREIDFNSERSLVVRCTVLYACTRGR